MNATLITFLAISLVLQTSQISASSAFDYYSYDLDSMESSSSDSIDVYLSYSYYSFDSSDDKPACSLLKLNEACSTNDQCCSGKCSVKGRGKNKGERKLKATGKGKGKEGKDGGKGKKDGEMVCMNPNAATEDTQEVRGLGISAKPSKFDSYSYDFDSMGSSSSDSSLDAFLSYSFVSSDDEPVCQLLKLNEPCITNDDCCSGMCSGKGKGRKANEMICTNPNALTEKYQGLRGMHME
mmetsp:Transcript_26069/g.42482  ORF Transcript_26069/g.42482 Transcript_26069/m.42482 type:complete len:238 (+) Transcript_26069:149-862(+)